MENDILLDVQHLSHMFHLKRKMTVKAIDDVSFQIKKGEIYGLVGESGSVLDRFQPFVGGFLSRHLNGNMGEPAVLLGPVPVLDFCRNGDDSAGDNAHVR